MKVSKLYSFEGEMVSGMVQVKEKKAINQISKEIILDLRSSKLDSVNLVHMDLLISELTEIKEKMMELDLEVNPPE